MNLVQPLFQIALIYKELDEAERYFLQITEDEELCADAYLELAIYLVLYTNEFSSAAFS